MPRTIGWLLVGWVCVAGLRGASPEELVGRLLNGTTQKPIAAGEVVLVKAGAQGMEVVRTLRSDAAGQFNLGGRALLQKDPYVLQTTFQGVPYSLSIQHLKETAPALLTVYEADEKMDHLKVGVPHMMIRRAGAILQVSEIFQIDNSSEPPKTLFSKQGNFRFTIPSQARLVQVVTSSGGSLMPVTVEARKIKDGSGWTIASPIKPGKNMVQVAYQADYPKEQTELVLKYFYPLNIFQMMVSPGDIQVRSSLLQEAGSQGNKMRLFNAPSIPANMEMTITLSGGSPQALETNDEEEEKAADPNREENASSQIIAVPPVLSTYRFVIIGNLLLLLAAFIGWTLSGGTSEEPKNSAGSRTRQRRTAGKPSSSLENRS